MFSDETEPQLQQQQQQQLAPNNVDEVRLEEPLQVSYIYICTLACSVPEPPLFWAAPKIEVSWGADSGSCL